MNGTAAMRVGFGALVLGAAAFRLSAALARVTAGASNVALFLLVGVALACVVGALVLRGRRRAFLLAFAAVGGHNAGLLVAVALLQHWDGLIDAVPPLIVLVWLCVRPGFWPTVILGAIAALEIALGIPDLLSATDTFTGLSQGIHITWRVLTIALLGWGYVRFRQSARFASAAGDLTAVEGQAARPRITAPATAVQDYAAAREPGARDTGRMEAAQERGNQRAPVSAGHVPAGDAAADVAPSGWPGDGDDVGLRAVRQVFGHLQVDVKWSQSSQRGFTWWGHEHAQRVWADEPYDVGGVTMCRVQAETDFLRGDPRTLQAQRAISMLIGLTSLSGIVHYPAAGIVRLRSSVYLHSENAGWLVPLFSSAVAIQAADAQAQASVTAKVTGLEPATSAHPISGPRSSPDDMLNVVDALVKPSGQGPSRWEGSAELAQVEEVLRHNGVVANAGPSGLTAEVGFGSNPGSNVFGKSSSLLQVSTESNPRYGSGLLLRLTLPVFAAEEAPGALPLALNALERETRNSSHFLGSWCTTPNTQQPLVVFVTFVPNFSYRGGLLVNLVMAMAGRAKWVGEVFADPQALQGVPWHDANRPADAERRPIDWGRDSDVLQAAEATRRLGETIIALRSAASALAHPTEPLSALRETVAVLVQEGAPLEMVRRGYWLAIKSAADAKLPHAAGLPLWEDLVRSDEERPAQSVQSRDAGTAPTLAEREMGAADAGPAAAHDGSTTDPGFEAVTPPMPAPNARRFCGQCGARVGAGARFCGQCGAAVDASKAAPRRRWLPPLNGLLGVLAILASVAFIGSYAVQAGGRGVEGGEPRSGVLLSEVAPTSAPPNISTSQPTAPTAPPSISTPQPTAPTAPPSLSEIVIPASGFGFTYRLDTPNEKDDEYSVTVLPRDELKPSMFRQAIYRNLTPAEARSSVDASIRRLLDDRSFTLVEYPSQGPPGSRLFAGAVVSDAAASTAFATVVGSRGPYSYILAAYGLQPSNTVPSVDAMGRLGSVLYGRIPRPTSEPMTSPSQVVRDFLTVFAREPSPGRVGSTYLTRGLRAVTEGSQPLPVMMGVQDTTDTFTVQEPVAVPGTTDMTVRATLMYSGSGPTDRVFRLVQTEDGWQINAITIAR